MIEVVQYLHKNPSILTLFKEGKISLLNVNPFEKQLLLEVFESKEKRSKKDSLLLYWHA